MHISRAEFLKLAGEPLQSVIVPDFVASSTNCSDTGDFANCKYFK